jgi:hypothetical protein
MRRKPISRRFVDYRWWRNRRAVRVEADGLVIERRLGREWRVPWVDVIGLRWYGPDEVVVETPSRTLRFERSVDGLEVFAEAVRELRSAAGGEPTSADVTRWLRMWVPDAWSDAPVAFFVAMLGLVFCAALAARLGAAQLCLEILLAVLFGLMAVGIGYFLVASVSRRLAAWRARRVGGSHREDRRFYDLKVDADGVTLRMPTGSRKLLWHEIKGCEPKGDALLLLVHGGTDLAIPASAEFRARAEAIQRVVRGLGGVHLEVGPVPDGALSLAHMRGGETDHGRGLSLLEREEHAS